MKHHRTCRNGTLEPAGAYDNLPKQGNYMSHCPYAQPVHDKRGTAVVYGFRTVASKTPHHFLPCRALYGGQNAH